jgi:cytochrome P450
MALIDYDDPTFIANPYPVYQKLRDEHPVFYWEEGFCWMFMKHEDVKPLLKDERLSTDFRKFMFYEPSDLTVFEDLMANGLFGLEREDHHRLRALAAPSLAPRIVEDATPMILDVIEETFASFKGRDRINFSTDVSLDIPREVVSRLVGVPTKDNVAFRAMAKAVIDCADYTMSAEERAEAAANIPAGLQQLEDIIEQRRKEEPRDDFLGTLIATQEGGQRLSTKEMITLIIALLSAGQEATMDVMNFVVKTFLEHSDVIPEALSDDELFANAVEEAIRFDYFGKAGAVRFVLDDFEYKGFNLKKGEMVRLHVPSALMDTDVFIEPERFDIHRNQKESLTFGYGPHFCIGAGLARLEVRLLAREFLKQFPNARIVGDVEYASHYMIRRIEKLEIQLT